MPDLILLNGPPASGKSTLAAALVARRPLALNLDIDLVRGSLGQWRSTPGDAGLAARRLALAMAGTHLGFGHDVIVPQFLAREEFIDQLAVAAVTAEARFVEVALLLDRDDAVAVFQRRSAQPASEQHRDAAEAVSAAGGVDALLAMYDMYVDMLELRPLARRVDVVVGDIAATVERVESAVALN
ncbi:MAG: hypothetical protein Q8M22_01745 [Actinomycetota bacterium]|nr:hypothetical protein [Actinomycetota bacterium]